MPDYEFPFTKYVLYGEVLGQGASSVVFKCRRRGDDQGQAVQTRDYVGKIMVAGNAQGTCANRRKALERLRELKILESLRHPNIVELVGHDEIPGFIVIVTVYEPLGDLAKFLERSDRSFYPQEAALVFRQLLEAIGFLHLHAVFHRDVKPSNVLVASHTQEDNIWKLIVKLADFGLSKILYDPETCSSSSRSVHGFVGTKAYAAPEMDALSSSDSEIYNSTALDTWSLGILLYETLTKSLPRNVSEGSRDCTQSALDEDIREKISLVPGQCCLEDLLLRLLRKNSEQRISVAEAVHMLHQHFPEPCGVASTSSICSRPVRVVSSGCSSSHKSLQRSIGSSGSSGTARIARRRSHRFQALDRDAGLFVARHQIEELCMKTLAKKRQQEASDFAIAEELTKQQLWEQQDQVRREASERYKKQRTQAT